MPPARDLRKEPPFGLLTVLDRVGVDRHGRIQWRCKCRCGEETIVSSHNLVNGDTTSCGCARKKYRQTLGRVEKTRRHLPKLNLHVWPKVCQMCNQEFLGTNRQQYCRIECRPSRRKT